MLEFVLVSHHGKMNKDLGVIQHQPIHIISRRLVFVEAIIAVFSILYVFWPLLILFGIKEMFHKGRLWKERLRLGLQRVFVGWVAWAFALGVIYCQNHQPILLLPRFYDHLFFGLLGALSGGVSLGWILYRWKNRRVRLADAQSLESLLNLSPEAFERLVAELFKRYGYQVSAVGGSSDHGVDVVVQTNDDEKWIVQCKRYGGSVGEPVVRDLYGTMLHEEAQRAFLITTGTLTSQAREWARGKPLVLYDGEALVTLIRRTQQRKANGNLN